jgi:hypothetical protein
MEVKFDFGKISGLVILALLSFSGLYMLLMNNMEKLIGKFGMVKSYNSPLGEVSLRESWVGGKN